MNSPATVMITRRCSQRTFLFRPSPAVTEMYRYLLAVLSSQYGIQVHAAVLMSTHEHLVITDPAGRRSEFLQAFHRMVANTLKVMVGWRGEVFDGRPTSMVQLLTPEAVVEKVAYLAANPVEAGLVRHARDWPGVQTLPAQLGRARWTLRRPGVYLDPENPSWPQTASMELIHPEVTGMTPAAFRDAVSEEMERLEQAAREKLIAEGRRFAGRKAVLRASRFKRAMSWEEKGALNPTFATGRGQREVFFEAVRQLRTFRHAYREAMRAWVQGNREVLFPAGTLQMQTLHQVRVAPS